jgi:serine/threonine-protein kinase
MPAPVSDEAFARAAQQMGAATPEQLEAARRLQAQQAGVGGELSLGDALVRQGVLTAALKENIEKRLGPKVIGPYQLLDKIGEGAMGAVYRGKVLKTGVEVAVKILPEKFAADRSYIARFEREARAGMELDHPHVVRTVDFGHQQDAYFIALELVEGGDLAKRQKTVKVLPEADALRVIHEVALGLQHAHEKGLVHRDIKPSNIMFGKDGKAKLSDFGLVKYTDPETSTLTQTGYAVGTPLYFSPEQARGEKDVDIRADIYALGATLYHLVTGRPPVEGSSLGEIIMKHLNGRVTPPDELNPALSDGCVALIERMMARERKDRYAAPLELIVDVERVRRGEAPVRLADFGASTVEVSTRRMQQLNIPKPVPVPEVRQLPHDPELKDRLGMVAEEKPTPRPPPRRRTDGPHTAVAQPEADLGAAAWLEAVEGPLTGKRFTVSQKAAIGRHTTNDVLLDDPTVGRSHAAIQFKDGVWLLWDLTLQGENTFVNGKLLTRFMPPVEVKDGDRLRFSKTECVFHIVLSSPAQPATPVARRVAERAEARGARAAEARPPAGRLAKSPHERGAGATPGRRLGLWIGAVAALVALVLVVFLIASPGGKPSATAKAKPGQPSSTPKQPAVPEQPAKAVQPPTSNLKPETVSWPLHDGKEPIADYAKRVGLPATETLDLGGGVKMEFVLVPAGEFTIGDRGTQGTSQIIKFTEPFYAGKFEVTVSQFRRFTEASGHKTDAEKGGKALVWKDGTFQLMIGAHWKSPGFQQGDDHPVCAVSWKDAQAFTTWATQQTATTVRLPSDAQWEYACRAGTKTKFCTGDSEADLGLAGWYKSNSSMRTSMVGQKKPNAWGLYDMHGNVGEYVGDRNDIGFSTIRGGSFGNFYELCESGKRNLGQLDLASAAGGFRVVLLSARAFAAVAVQPQTTNQKPQTGARLEFASGAKKGQSVAIEKDLTIGRDPDNRLVLDDAKASRSHAMILRRSLKFMLNDMASANGTLLNGVKMDPARNYDLSDGDQIRIGDTLLVFRLGAAMPATVQPQTTNQKPETKAVAGEPTQIGGYKIVRKLGGGMLGAAYEAEDVNLQRRLFIRVLADDFVAKPDWATRFENGARAWSKLAHPNIATLHNYGPYADRRFTAVEFVDGDLLSEIIKRDKALPPAKALDIAAQLAQGLKHIHDRGIVLRDLKPSVVSLTKDGTPKILDFFLALDLKVEQPPPGVAVGTPAYCPLEQWRGEKTIDGRADIYALGVTLWEMLAGAPPFKPPGDVKALPAFVQKLTKDPLPDLKKLRPDLPDALVKVIEKMLAKKPEDRYRNCDELLNALEALKQSAGKAP